MNDAIFTANDEDCIKMFRIFSKSEEVLLGKEGSSELVQAEVTDKFMEELFWAYLLFSKDKFPVRVRMLEILRESREKVYLVVVRKIELHNYMLYDISTNENQ